MKINFTDEQKAAIRARGKDVIVSAAAGSGKTATLTERIIQRLCDPDSPGDISRMLIVTFTNAAAADMRNKISEALSLAVANNPYNKHLRKQKIMLQSARICTIHSFFFDIVRANFEKLNISPTARIADDEGKSLANTVMRDVIGRRILQNDNRNDNPDDNIFDNLFELLSYGGIEKRVHGTFNNSIETFIKIYNRLLSYPEGVEFVRNSAERVKNLKYETFFSSSEGAGLIKQVKDFFLHFKAIYEAILENTQENDTVNKAYRNSFESDYMSICKVLECQDPTEMLALIDGIKKEKPKKNLNAADKDEKTQNYLNARDKFHALLKKKREKGFGLKINEEEFPEYCRLTYAYLACLYDILKEFEREFKKVKAKLGILDFADAERMALRLLIDENGNPTPVAYEIRSMFDEIYIDEYQDVNEIQEKLFCVISKNNRFMVGDVKQSIYGFRGSCPEIFSEYRKKFADYAQNVNSKNVNSKNVNSGNANSENVFLRDTKGYRIFMSDNFRCDKGIIDFSNDIFEKLFPYSNIDYCEKDKLKHGKKEDAANETVELVIFDKNYTEETEAGFVAKRIRAYLDAGRQPKEIAILTRKNTPDKLKELEAELIKYDIPVDIQRSENFFEKSEILLLMSLLNCIDNPTREIWLAGALRSPVFGFTLDELYKIKNYRKKVEFSGAFVNGETDLFYNLCLYAEETGDEKCKRFLEWLSECRKIERQKSVDKLVSFVIESCLIIPLVLKTKDAEERKQSILSFTELAANFVAAGGTTLTNFIRKMNEAAKTGDSKNGNDNSPNVNKVRVMTIHVSKGQEFPICFVFNAGSKIINNLDDEPYLIDRELGFGIKLRSGEGLIQVATPLYKNILAKTKEKQIDEEMRVLYVALTRAKEKLIVTATVGQRVTQKSLASESMTKECSFEADYITPYLLSERNSFVEWILLCRPKHVQMLVNGEAKSKNDNLLQTDAVVKKEIDNSDVEEKYEFIKERLSFVYPYSIASSLPAKISVSELYPSLLDEINSDAQTLPDFYEESNLFSKKPLFLSESAETEAKATEKGVATHVFMQFCNFDNCVEKGVEFEISRLVENKFIPPAFAELIDTESVGGFFRSELFSKMKNAKRLTREARFNVKLPAEEFTTDEKLKAQIKALNETIFVQGVIDCYFYDKNDNLVIVDYKTDRFTKAQLAEPEKVREILKARHSLQLGYYKKALEIITKKKVSNVYLYSFALNEAFDMDI